MCWCPRQVTCHSSGSTFSKYSNSPGPDLRLHRPGWCTHHVFIHDVRREHVIRRVIPDGSELVVVSTVDGSNADDFIGSMFHTLLTPLSNFITQFMTLISTFYGAYYSSSPGSCVAWLFVRVLPTSRVTTRADRMSCRARGVTRHASRPRVCVSLDAAYASLVLYCVVYTQVQLARATWCGSLQSCRRVGQRRDASLHRTADQ